jgi:hypothetical protein
MKHYPCIVVDIYESDMYPVVTHIFRGKTLSEAREYFQAHMKTDSFLRGAVNTGYYKGMRTPVEIKEVDGG